MDYKDIAIDFAKVNQYIFDGDFVTNELIETYEAGPDNSPTLVDRQAHEIKNGSTDACKMRFDFLNHFVNKILYADNDNSSVRFAVNSLRKNGFLIED